jgi:hypothetical protein
MSMSKFALGITAAVFLISTGGLMNEALKHHRIEAGLAAAQANYSTELDRVRQLERSFNAISVSAPGARRAAPQVQAPGVSPDAAEKTRALEAAHPEIQSAWQRYMQANAYQRYDGRLAELGVTPSQLDRFLQLKEGRLVMIDGPNGEPYRFMSDPLSEGLSQSDVESELQTLLGPATYQRVKDFEAAAPVRESVSAAAGLALLAGTPLSAAQANGLAQAMNDNPAEPQIENILNPGQRVIFEAVLSQRAVSAELQAAAQKAAEAPVLQE